MTKTKWQSKLLSLSIIFSLVFSLVAMVAPVAAEAGEVEAGEVGADELVEAGAIDIDIEGGEFGAGNAALNVTITAPLDGEIISACTQFLLSFNITNTGDCNTTAVSALIWPTAGVEVVVGGIGQGGGVSYTAGPWALLQPGETECVNVTMHCVTPGYTTIHVDPTGIGECVHHEIPKDYLHSDIVGFNQVFGLSCNATPNPTKVGHNTTFSVEIGEGAVYPVAWAWNFDDDGDIDQSGTSSSSPIETWWIYNATGNYTADVSVTDGSTTTVNCSVPIDVFPPLGVNCNVTPLETKLPHCLNFTAMRDGGLPETYVSYTWSWNITDENGMTVDTSDQQNFEYCPTSAGNYSGTVILTDDLVPANTANCTTEIAQVYPALNVTCDAYPRITKVPHCINFTAMAGGGVPGNTLNWSWNFTDDATGVNVHNATSQNVTWCPPGGNYTGTVTVTDAELGNTANCSVSVQVYPPVTVICDVTPDPQNVCHAVNFTAEVTAGSGMPGASYNWSWEFKNDDGDVVVGTSTEQNPSFIFMCVGNYTGYVTACDNLTPTNCASCNVSVEIIIEAPELIAPENGVTVNSNMVCFEWEDIGCCNYTLEVFQKDGLECKVWLVDTGKDNFWCGPIMDGNYKWQVTASDSCNNSATSEIWYFGVQESAIAVTVTSPNGGEVLSANGTAAITWDAAYADRYEGGFGSSQDDLLADISYSSDSGATWETIATDEPNDGVYAWTVPMVGSNQCLVMVTVSDDLGNDGVDTSNSVFSIVLPSDTTDPMVTVVSPNGAENYAGGSSQAITWTATDDVGVTSVDLYLSSNGGVDWAVVALDETNDGTYTWTVPAINSVQCLVKAVAFDAAGNSASDMSNSVFIIATEDADVNAPVVTVNRPVGGETFTGGSQEFILWNATDDVSAQSDITIALSYKVGIGDWTSITFDGVNDGEFKWTVPDINSSQVLVKVEATDEAGNTGFADSDNEFTVITVIVAIADTGASFNGTVIEPITITGVVDMASVDVWLTYDSSVVNVSAINTGDLGVVMSSIDNTAGIAKINWFSGTGLSGDLDICNVEFKAVGSAGETSGLEIEVKSITDSDANPIPVVEEDGLFTVLALMEGDVTLNGHVTIADAMFVAQYKAGLRSLNADQLEAADTFDDGPLVDASISDAMHIAQWLVDPDGALSILVVDLWVSPGDDHMLEPVAA